MPVALLIAAALLSFYIVERSISAFHPLRTSAHLVAFHLLPHYADLSNPGRTILRVNLLTQEYGHQADVDQLISTRVFARLQVSPP